MATNLNNDKHMTFRCVECDRVREYQEERACEWCDKKKLCHGCMLHIGRWEVCSGDCMNAVMDDQQSDRPDTDQTLGLER